jgi:hypothetical protein
MSEHAFDALTRRASTAVSRRSSLAALGGAALVAAVASPAIVEASKAGKKAKKKARKKCRQQQGQCEASVQTFCASLNGAASESVSAEGSCLGLLLPCCASLSTCDAATSTTCFLGIL